MDIIKRMAKTFINILAGITFSATLFITLFFPNTEFSILLLWQIIIMSAVCASGNLFFYSKNELSKKSMKIRMILHYLFINVVVLGGAHLWGWLKPGVLLEFFVMVVLIAAVYIMVMVLTIRQEEKTAEKLNQKLRKYYSAEEEKEEA